MSFDPAKFPRLQVRKTLLIVDAQNDFLSSEGRLPVVDCDHLTLKISMLVSRFRMIGDIIWVRSEFKATRNYNHNHTLASESSDSRTAVPDSEAFLTYNFDQPFSAPGSEGAQIPLSLQSIYDDKVDTIIVKNHYSSFKDTNLVRRLRQNIATELYICGSLANIGVLATAIDATPHGHQVTVLRDCCGWRKEERRDRAFAKMEDVYACRLAAMRNSSSVMSSISQSQRFNASRSHNSFEQPSIEPDNDCSANEKGKPPSDSVQKTPKKEFPEKSPVPTMPRQTESTTPSNKNASKTPRKEEKAPKQDPKPPHLERLCEGDTTVIQNVLEEPFATDAFAKLLDEVQWEVMSHRSGEVPRRVAVQGTVEEDGSKPLYRHPADESPPLNPFSPTVLEIKKAVEEHLGHRVNHVLIQHYRTGHDYISEHSDKTLDIARTSYIANVSLGAQRTMIFRTKRADKVNMSKGSEPDNGAGIPRLTERVALPHNSLLRMGLYTNKRWLHAIKQDRRADRDKEEPSLAFGGARISLTFRNISTFISSDDSKIWGQGAVGKTKKTARNVLHGDHEETDKVITAFGRENHDPLFDWDEAYGEGSDVLHMKLEKAPEPEQAVDGEKDAEEVDVKVKEGTEEKVEELKQEKKEYDDKKDDPKEKAAEEEKKELPAADTKPSPDKSAAQTSSPTASTPPKESQKSLESCSAKGSADPKVEEASKPSVVCDKGREKKEDASVSKDKEGKDDAAISDEDKAKNEEKTEAKEGSKTQNDKEGDTAENAGKAREEALPDQTDVTTSSKSCAPIEKSKSLAAIAMAKNSEDMPEKSQRGGAAKEETGKATTLQRKLAELQEPEKARKDDVPSSESARDKKGKKKEEEAVHNA
ncbi:hypothetical protein TD95_004722 [Thielaviopsis punctulata]|uniref:Fe2OG dioxygenase domain-containing protein n=1 Tax=Thielaviopsis punctulata TaxID=72032 RepID=A0A0F4ZB79_9PEZI|nr:hypothetical protein TD95_004722 [Thielaviopsis punctulata]